MKVRITFELNLKDTNYDISKRELGIRIDN